jgi:polysaccharide export outer membrane protein
MDMRESNSRSTIPLGGALLGLVLLAEVAILSPQSIAQSNTPPQQIGGQTSLPSSSTAAGRGNGRAPNAAGGIEAVPEDFSSLTLAPGFLLNVQVYDMPEISSQLRIDDNGDIALPLAGKLHVAGMTLPQAQAAIEQRFKREEILQNPEINVDVAQYAVNDVSVLGEVVSPGRFQLLAPHSLAEVLAMVGGETQIAGDSITLRHKSDMGEQSQVIPYSRSGNSNDIRQIMIQPGDTVVVPRAGIVYVLGGVNRPGGYVMQEDGKLDVAQALSMAYGTALDAAVGSIRVIRKKTDGSLETIPISYRKITKGEIQPATLQAGDIVYVPISKFKSVMTAGVSASTSSAAIYALH